MVSCIKGKIFPQQKSALRIKTEGHADDHQLGRNSGPNSWYVCAQNTTGIFLFTGDVYPLGTYDIIYLHIAVPVARPKHETYKPEIWMCSPCFRHDFTHGKLSSNSFPKRWQKGKPTNCPTRTLKLVVFLAESGSLNNKHN